MEYYQELGLEKNATEDDIKKAYKKLALKYHPDKAPADKKEEYTQKFQKISEANEVLSNTDKRKIYDIHGKDGLKPQPQNTPDVFNDFFRNFGFGFGQPQQRKNADTIFQLDLTLKDIYCGVTKKIKITKQIIVDSKGDISTSENNSTKCSDCNGLGFTIQGTRNGNMFSQIQQQCVKCSGLGNCLLENFKMQESSEIINIDIPKGANHGEQRRFDKQGNQSPGVIPGDVVVIFNVTLTDNFTRNGNNLEYMYSISLTEALCGGVLKLLMPDDKLFNINYDCVSMKEGIAEKKMVPNLGFNGGNLIISFSITFPVLNDKQKEKIKKLL